MESVHVNLRVKGRMVSLPSVNIENRLVIIRGKWFKTASIHDDKWIEGEVLHDPEAAMAILQKAPVRADLFTFPQNIPDIEPRFKHPMEWDNVAAVVLSNYTTWWEGLPQESRKHVRKSVKLGVQVRTVECDDVFAQGVTAIYNETPFRQGRPFSKYHYDFQTVKSELIQLRERSEYIGAYFNDNLIGFIKIVYLGPVASILSILSRADQYDKKVTNALIAKAVEVSCDREKTHMLYGAYIYGNKSSSPMTEFKRRNGFVQILVPRYYIPLTLKGRICYRLGIHRGLIGILPEPLIAWLQKLRASMLSVRARFGPRRREAVGSRE